MSEALTSILLYEVRVYMYGTDEGMYRVWTRVCFAAVELFMLLCSSQVLSLALLCSCWSVSASFLCCVYLVYMFLLVMRAGRVRLVLCLSLARSFRSVSYVGRCRPSR